MHERTRCPRMRATGWAMVGTALAAVAGACGGSDGGTPVDPDPPPPPEPPRAASITVSPASAALSFLGDTALFAAVVRDQYGALFGAAPTWASSDTTVFTIGVAGIATAVGNGSGVVTASFQELSATATVAVVQAAASVELVSGGDQSARQGRTLGESIVVRVADAGGATVAGAPVSFVPAEGDGTVAPDSVASDSVGLAATVWTLGDRPGAQQLAVLVATPDGPAVDVSATALTPEETVATLAVASGDGQQVRQGRVLGDSIAVRATDAEGEAVQGAVIVFAPADGDGTVAPDSVTSDSTGLAATVWTLADRPGTQQLAASVATPDGPAVDVSATALTPEETVATLAVASGDGQQVRQGRVLGDSIAVRATDAEGEAVQGAVIVFAPADGDGTVAPDSVTSDSTGLAATVWTLGNRPGTQRLAVAAATAGGPSVEVAATALTPEETVAALAVASGDGQEAEEGSALGEPIVVRATDAEGEAVEGAVIVFAPADGDGVAEPDSAATDSTGTARTTWTLGDHAGEQRLTATVAAPDAPSTQAVATATRRRPNRPPETTESLPTHVLTAGGRELTLPGADYFDDPDGDPLSLSATASDPGVANVVAESNGDFTVITGSPGISQLVLTATDPGGSSAHLRFSAIVLQVPHYTQFDIDVVWLTRPSAATNRAFGRAVARWQQVVTADVPNIQFSGQENNWCGIRLRFYAEVDDLVVFAVVRNIDGNGGTLARAGPCIIRQSGLPLFAGIDMDSSDIDDLGDDGLFVVSLHEMGHTLGIGTLWSHFGLLRNPSLPDNPGADTHFTGPRAIAAFDEAANFSYGGGAKVPVENQAESGSSDSHWRRSVFGSELMNPSYSPGRRSPMSAITIQSLADLGYQVDVGQADSYALPRAGLHAEAGVPPTGTVSLGADVFQGPVAVVGPDGRVVRVLRR